MDLPETIKRAISELTRIPGVGEKTAMRQVLTISRWDKASLESLGRSIANLSMLSACEKCGFYTDEKLCQVCSDHSRVEARSICVVEDIGDMIAIENSGHFKGTFHVLGGVLNPLLGIGPNELKLPRLINRVRNEGITEIVLAVNPSVEGDATCSYINQEVGTEIDVDRIGFGIPMGGSLEYLDSMTITKALENKKRLT